ncbi:MAG: hypothetical protein CBC33_000910 [Coraliomargarita sp. TMED73]|nr:MAG: hypothetical protein CBC33_000910 [Coraliomargarita sp. TMED73]
MSELDPEALAVLLPRLRTVIDGGLLVLIWMVQRIVYPIFLEIHEDRLQAWHARYMPAIGSIVGPLMLLQVAVILLQVVLFGRPVDLISGSLVLAVWISTAVFSVPCHRRIEQGRGDRAVLQRLVLTNWPRTILWTIIFLVGWW